MKTIRFAALSLLCFLISACSQAVVETPAIISPVPQATQTLTLPLAPSATLTLTPDTLTPVPPTSTPLPTIPTFTPAFDVRTIVTATPAPKAECPKENSSAKPNLDVLFEKGSSHINEQALLDFLDQGGSSSAIMSVFRDNFPLFRPGDALQQDITNDKVAELLLSDHDNIYVFTCKGGKYYQLFDFTYDPAWLRGIRFKTPTDMNGDGIPELPVIASGGPNNQISASIFEFDGNESLKPVLFDLENGISFPFSDTFFVKEAAVIDIDGNGTSELVLTVGIPPEDALGNIYPSGFPWREEKRIYIWNGTSFISDGPQYSAPQYPFQFIQDADRFVLKGEFTKAMLYFQQVVAAQNLDWWSKERYEWYLFKNSGNNPTPLPKTSSHASDYPQIAAYAYYRMVILHIKLGEMDAAQTQYATLQEKFPAGNPGYPYVEMATTFWDAYQSTGKMYDACAAAIAYADAHPEILTVLGSDYHGWQSHIYIPADVCPFR